MAPVPTSKSTARQIKGKRHMPVKLRDHQVEAVDAILPGLDIPPGKKLRIQQDHHRSRGLDWILRSLR